MQQARPVGWFAPATLKKGEVQADEQQDEQQAQEEPADHGLGRSHGGLTTKIHLISDAKARPVSAVLSAGQTHDIKCLQALLDSVRVPTLGRGRPRKRPIRLALDKGYSFPASRQLLRRRGIRCMIPEREDHRNHRKKMGSDGGRPCLFDRAFYRWRNVVERCALRLKQFRRVATRYDKRADVYLASISFAAIIIWLRS